LVGWLAGWLIGWLVRSRSVGRLVGSLVGRLVDSSVGWLFDSLVRPSVGRSVTQSASTVISLHRGKYPKTRPSLESTSLQAGSNGATDT